MRRPVTSNRRLLFGSSLKTRSIVHLHCSDIYKIFYVLGPAGTVGYLSEIFVDPCATGQASCSYYPQGGNCLLKVDQQLFKK